jgi:membrane protein DedA with SNARE-associated domain
MADVMINQALSRFTQMGYALLGLGTLAEGLSLPFPSVLFVIMAGAAVARGKMSFWAVVLLASSTYTLGSIIPYYMGYHLKKLDRYPWMKAWLDRIPKPAQAVNKLFLRHGNKIVALSRPFWIGNCVSYFAGLNHMPTLKFLFYTFAGILPWAIAATYAGTIFGANMQGALDLISQYTYSAMGLIAALLVGGASWQLVTRRKKKIN